MNNTGNNNQSINTSEFENAFDSISRQCDDIRAINTALYFIIDNITSTEYYSNDILTLVTMQERIIKSAHTDILNIESKVNHLVT